MFEWSTHLCGPWATAETEGLISLSLQMPWASSVASSVSVSSDSDSVKDSDSDESSPPDSDRRGALLGLSRIVVVTFAAAQR